MTDRDIWTQSVNLLNWTDGQKPGRNSNYPKNPRGQRQLRGLCLGWSSQSCYHSHIVWTDWKYRHNKTRTRNTSQIQTRQDRRRTTWQIIRWYTSNHMFFCECESYFQHDLYLVKCQDKHGVGGDLRLSGMSARGNECLWRQRAERRTGEEKQEEEKRKKRRAGLWFMPVLIVDLLSLSRSLISLFPPHILSIYLSLLSFLLPCLIPRTDRHSASLMKGK